MAQDSILLPRAIVTVRNLQYASGEMFKWLTPGFLYQGKHNLMLNKSPCPTVGCEHVEDGQDFIYPHSQHSSAIICRGDTPSMTTLLGPGTRG